MKISSVLALSTLLACSFSTLSYADESAVTSEQNTAQQDAYTVPEITAANCKDKTLLIRMLERVTEAAQKNDLDKETLLKLHDFTEKCRLLLTEG